MKTLSTAASNPQHVEMLLAAMREIGLFDPLSDEDLRVLAYFVSAVEFDEGETAVQKGDLGDTCYIICSGRAEARAPGIWGDEVLGSLGHGDFFGELALLLDQPRNADVVCLEAVRCLALGRSDLETLMTRSPDVAELVRAIARRRFEESS